MALAIQRPVVAKDSHRLEMVVGHDTRARDRSKGTLRHGRRMCPVSKEEAQEDRRHEQGFSHNCLLSSCNDTPQPQAGPPGETDVRYEREAPGRIPLTVGVFWWRGRVTGTLS